MEYTTDILIIGAGAAGLMAAYRLSGSGQKIVVVEARGRTGGRIHTTTGSGFTQPAELGAEFVHGPLPLTLSLLKTAGIPVTPVKGAAWTAAGGRLHQEDAIGDDWPLLMRKLAQLEEDCSIKAFLDREFTGERYAALRQSVIRFAEGYDAADADRASAIALREEWKGEEEEQYRVSGGYCRLVQWLQERCEAAGVGFHLGQPVREIRWSAGDVTVITASGDTFRAAKAIFTLPAGVWQDESAPLLSPEPAGHLAALRSLGYGQVIKFLLEFREPFWKDADTARRIGKDLSKLGFLFSEEAVPTWWTQFPSELPLLTGWLAGPAAAEKRDWDKNALLALALQSLSRIFGLPVVSLRQELVAGGVANWSTHPYTLGAYAYATVNTPAAWKVLATPVADTLYFAGEALYDGPAMGTVEAALCSGQEAALRIAGNAIKA